jgi:WD40 repeat protein
MFSRRELGFEGLAVAPSGTLFAGIVHGSVHLGETVTEEPPRLIPELGTNNTSVRFSVDARFLFAGSNTGDVRIWSLPGKRLEHQLRPVTLPIRRLLQDGRGRNLVVVPSDDLGLTPGRACRISIWKVADWEEQNSLIIHGSREVCAISPDGCWLAAGVPWQPMQVWDLKLPTRPQPTSFSVGTVTGLVFSPDGLRLAACNEEGAVRIWTTPAFREEAAFSRHVGGINTLTFSPDSGRLVTVGQGEEAIKIWEVETWQNLLTVSLPGESIKQLAFSQDGNRLFALTSRGDLLLWRVPSCAEIDATEEAL